MRSRGTFFNIIEIFNPLLRYNGRTQGTVLCVLLILAFLLPITISQIISYFQHRDRPLCCTLLRNAIIRKWKIFGLCNRILDITIRIVYDVFATDTSTYSDNNTGDGSLCSSCLSIFITNNYISNYQLFSTQRTVPCVAPCVAAVLPKPALLCVALEKKFEDWFYFQTMNLC